MALNGGTVADRNNIQDQRRRLLGRITTFHNQADTFLAFLGNDFNDDAIPPLANPFDDAVDENPFLDDRDDSDSETDEDEELPPQQMQPEHMKLRMPSTVLASFAEAPPALELLVRQEKELRMGQANDALAQLRIDIGHKALLFRDDVRNARGTDKRTRAWKHVHDVDHKVAVHAGNYRLARSALVLLNAAPETLQKYKTLQPEDLKTCRKWAIAMHGKTDLRGVTV